MLYGRLKQSETQFHAELLPLEDSVQLVEPRSSDRHPFVRQDPDKRAYVGWWWLVAIYNTRAACGLLGIWVGLGCIVAVTTFGANISFQLGSHGRWSRNLRAGAVKKSSTLVMIVPSIGKSIDH